MTEILNRELAVVEVPTCCGPKSSAKNSGETKFHFALNVSSMEQSVAFYRILFGVPPAKHHHDYAKFELSQPPLVFSLVPNPPSSGGSLSHCGFPVESTEDVHAAAARLSAAGLEISCQEGTVCGYARQDKVWVADPDRNFWEIYVVHEDVDPETVRAAFDGVAPTEAPAIASTEVPDSEVIWEHRVLMPLPDRIPYDDGMVDEVRLVGTFNDELSEADRAKLLAEAIRVLRPGGTLSVHGLVASGPLNGTPQLPGVTALVQRVPLEHEPLREIAKAGFEAVRVTKLPEAPAFRDGALEFRELKLEARKPDPSGDTQQERVVIYKGPFPSAEDDGQKFLRGQRTPVSQITWNRLTSGAAASQFVFLGAACADRCGCG